MYLQRVIEFTILNYLEIIFFYYLYFPNLVFIIWRVKGRQK